MKKNVLIVLYVFLSVVSNAQEMISNKAVFIELGGSGIAASLNYEQNIWMKNSNVFALKGGLGYFPVIVNANFSMGTGSVILGGTYTRKFKNFGLNLGVSTALTSTIVQNDNNNLKTMSTSQLIIPQLGWRFQKAEKHSVFAGCGYSPIVSFNGLSLENELLQFKSHYYVLVGVSL